MVSTMPSPTAWRAKSELLQCVMCSPLAIGSRQADCTICARCRGGKLLRATRPRGLPQHDIEAVLFIAAADAPDRGRVALHLAGQCLDPLAGSDPQEDSGMLDLEPRL